MDGLDSADGKLVVTNRGFAARGVVEVLEKLEPTIGLEPMTCRLRTADEADSSSTQTTLDDAT